MRFGGLTQEMFDETQEKMVIKRSEGTTKRMKQGVVPFLRELFINSVFFLLQNFYVIFYYYLFFYAGVLLCQYKTTAKPILDGM